MNNRLILNLILHRHRSHQGFALVFSLGLGVAILVVTATMLMRAQSDQSQAVSQSAKNVANAAAEGGVARIQNFLAQNPAMAQYSMEDWSKAIRSYKGTDTTPDASATLAGMAGLAKQASCTLAGQTDSNVRQTLSSTMETFVDASQATATGVEAPLTTTPDTNNVTPKFQLIGYRYSNGQAQAVLQGMAVQGNTKQAKSTIALKFPVSSASADVNTQGFPGLWVKEYLRTGQNDNNPGTVNAHVLYDCSMNNNNTLTFTTTPKTNGSAAGYTYYVSNEIANGGKAVRIALPTGNPAPEKSLVPMPNPPTAPPANGTTAVTAPLVGNDANGNVTGSLTLPRTSDTTTSANYNPTTQTYYYTINSITGNGVNLQFTRGAKVVVFLTGNISIGGSSQITHDCQSTANSLACDATDVQILGSTAPHTDTTIKQKSFITKGNSAVCSIFFWAPTYTVEMSGGGNAGSCFGKTNPAATTPPSQPANQNGIYWVRAWIGGGQGVHQALNQSGSTWTAVKRVASMPKVTVGNASEWAMKPDGYTADVVASAPSVNTADVKSPSGNTCTVPNITGINPTDVNAMEQITRAIIGAGYSAGTATITSTLDTTAVSAPQIASQTPAAGTSAPCGSMISYSYKMPNGLIPSTLFSMNSSNDGSAAMTAITNIKVSGTTTTQCFTSVTKSIDSGSGNPGQPRVKSFSFDTSDGSTTTWLSTNTPQMPTNPYIACGTPIRFTYK